MTARITALATAIPACDEASSILRCLTSLDRAAAQVDVATLVVVAADRCADDTATRARAALRRSRALRGIVVEVDEGAAGVTREIAARLAVSHLRSTGHLLPHVWLTTTDADSCVDGDWLAAQLAWARRGLAGVTGLVRLGTDGDPVTVERYRRYVASRGDRVGHGHVHAANLGVRADWWARVGGFPAVASGEDHGLWRRLRDAGAEVLGVTDLGVTTSARLAGRAPDGLAGLLASLPA